MIKYLNLLFVVVLALATACNNTERETPNGMKYSVIKTGDGTLPKKDEVVVFDYALKDSKDSTWGSSADDGMPIATRIADSTRLKDEDGMSQMFRMLSKGDSAVTTMTVKKFFKDFVKAPLPKAIDSTLSVTYSVKIRNISSLDEYIKERNTQVKERDTKSIDAYVKENKLTTQADTSGLQYVIHNSTGGEKPTVNSCVEVKYTGRFLKTGQIFDKAEHAAFPLFGVIEGWRQGIPMLAKGDSATFFIPSRLAYGPQGYPGAIPPDAVLMFNVTLLDFKDNFDQQTRSCK
jgi:FKBP-type peptidyl-prolyl cis-trans isomerase FkpA